MNILALLLLLIAGQSAGAQPDPVPAAAGRQHSGLLIAGVPFAPADIANAEQQWDSYTAVPNVLITFSESGHAKWRRVQQGQVGQPLEISVDGEVVSTPILREIITGNQVTISGQFTVEEAAALARRIAPPRQP